MILRGGLGAAATLAGHTACAADAAAPLGRMGTEVQQLPCPSVARLAVGLVVTLALAVGAAMILRRAWPLFLRRRAGASHISGVDRFSLSATLTVHVVHVEGARFVIAEGRSGVAVSPLP